MKFRYCNAIKNIVEVFHEVAWSESKTVQKNMRNTEFKQDRQSNIRLSISHPNYILYRNIEQFIIPFTNNTYNVILDYGAGNAPYKSYFKYEKYIAVDVEQNKDNTIDYIIEPNSPLAIESEIVDLILCMDVLEHCNDVNSILKEFRRVLSVNGVLLISLPFMCREHEMPFDAARYTSSGIENILKANGFKDVRITKVGNSLFTLYTLFRESMFKYGETVNVSIFGKIVRRILRSLCPLFNSTIFISKPSEKDSVYHHLLISCMK